MKKISVVTLNYNSETSTRELLESLRKVSVDDHALEVIVVDNASVNPFKLTDDDRSRNTLLIRSEINTGFAGGNNIGIKYAVKNGADYVLVINNDAIVENDTIAKLKKILDSNPKVGVTVPKIYFAKGYEYHKDKYDNADLGKVIWYAGGKMDWKNVKSEHIGMDEVDRGQFRDEKSIDFMTGCCMLIKKEVFEKVGLFNESYFLYYEDADLSIRIKKSGYEIHYVPDAIAYHANAQSSGGSGSGLHDYFLTRNQMLFGMKYAPLRAKLALLKQSIKLLYSGRKYQKKGIVDYYSLRFGKGSYFGQE